MNNQVFFKILTIITLVSVLIGGIWYWWQFGRPEIKVKLDQEFRLKVNQVAFIESENIKIKFLDVTEDSRCPVNAQCVWGGQITIKVNIFKNNQDLGDFSLSRGGDEALATKTFHGYFVKLLSIFPLPRAGKEIKLSDYVITLVLSK